MLIGSYLFTLFRFTVPYINYKMNFDFIVNELCRSRYEPRYVDCEGHCVLRSLQKQHSGHGNHSQEQQGQTPRSADQPVLYLDTSAGLWSDSERDSSHNDYVYITPEYKQIASEVLLPPPRRPLL